ncbi:MAG: ribonuclease R family protein [Puniceicoccaceae bacterium]
MKQIREQIVELMQTENYIPMRPEQLAETLRIAPKERKGFFRLLDTLQEEGTVVLLKKDRLCLPKDADLVTGQIRFKQSGAAVIIPDPKTTQKTTSVVEVSAGDTGVAMHDDLVVARIQTEDEIARRGRQGGRRRKEPVPGRASARVIRILQRAQTEITGTLEKAKLFHYVIPDDPRIRQDIIVPDPNRSRRKDRPKVGDKVVVKLLEWKQRHLNPEGQIVKVLGKTHSPGAEFEAILFKYGLATDFPPKVVSQLEEIPDQVAPEASQGRLDIRHLTTLTIDPDDAKDFDDALSLEALADGEYRVGIHIADVCAYVKPNSPLDREAQRRGNSTYLVGTVIPMLPHKLSNGICSLVEAQDRLTKSVFVTFNSRGTPIHISFANTIIRSVKRLTYRQALAFLKEDDFKAIRATPMPPAHQTGSTGRALTDLDDSEIGLLQKTIRKLWHFAEIARKKRMKAGSLDLDMPEVKILVDEGGYADRLEVNENDISHQLVEEYMLMANEAVAKSFREQGIAGIYRVHDDPDDERLLELREYLDTMGVYVGDLTNRKEVTRMLEAINKHPQGYAMRIQFLRSLKQAAYRASADGHYGLNKVDYTHFTSPIRRYADLVVHRIFDRLLQKQMNETAPIHPISRYQQGRLESIAEHISITERNSVDAERESVKVKLLEFFERELKKPEKTVFDAVIVDVKNHGFFIELTQALAFGLVHVSTLRDDLYSLSPDGTALVGRRQKHSFRLGGRIKVVTERVDRFKRQIDFAVAEMPSDDIPVPFQPKQTRKRSRNGRRRR